MLQESSTASPHAGLTTTLIGPALPLLFKLGMLWQFSGVLRMAWVLLGSGGYRRLWELQHKYNNLLLFGDRRLGGRILEGPREEVRPILLNLRWA